VIPTAVEETNWNTAYGWGNHASAGYLTSQVSHADVVQDGDFASQGIMLRGASSGVYSILADNSAAWNSALQPAGNGAALTHSTLTSGRVVLAGASGVLTDDADLTFNGTTLTLPFLEIKTSAQSTTINNYYGANSDGLNIWIGGGGASSVGEVAATYKGSLNVSLGVNALYSNTTGYYNMAIGGNSMLFNTSGARNVAVGFSSLRRNLTGSENIAIGSVAMDQNTTGSYNVAIGGSALTNNNNGESNFALGTNALYANVSGNSNIAIGSFSLQSSAGDANVAIGSSALVSLTSGISNVAIGYHAGYYETGSNKLFIDNTERASEADARIKALIYGVFASTVVAQDLVINGQVGVNVTPSAWLTLRAGSADAGTAPLKMTVGTNLTTPEDGTIEYDGTRFYITEVDVRRVISRASDAITSSVTVADTTDETTVFTAPLTANTIKAGKVYRVHGFGKASTHDAADTVTIKIKTSGTTIVTLNAKPGIAADDPMQFLISFTCRTIGASGTFSGYGEIVVGSDESRTNTSSSAINTTVLNNITVTFQWDSASADNTITLDQCYLEISN
jgi:hypothetical protein